MLGHAYIKDQRMNPILSQNVQQKWETDKFLLKSRVSHFSWGVADWASVSLSL